MSARSFVAIISNLLFLSQMFYAQTGTQPESQSVIRATRREVLVDMVVRDKHHHIISNLRPDEVEVYEDGVLQKLNAFRTVEGAEQLETERAQAKRENKAAIADNSAQEKGVEVTSLRQLNFVAVVFANIAPLNVPFAKEAVLDFLKSDNLPNTYISLYKFNRTLKIMKLYTDDKGTLARAVETAVKGVQSDDGLGTNAQVVSASYAALQAAAENIINSPRVDEATAMAARNRILDPMPIVARDTNLARDAAALDSTIALGNALLAQAKIEKGIRFASSLSNGMDTLDALRDVIQSQEGLPGRKVVIYLSDGLDFPMDRRDAIDSVISYANRSNVSFYAVDTRGLSPEDPMMASLASLERTAALSSAQKTDPLNGHKQDDEVQLTAVNNKQLAMRELAESTGGFAVSDTNQIAAPMEHVMEDIRSHYELAYTPTATNYDGRFRTIEVKVKRPHVKVQSRKGYFALPDINGQPIQPYEAVALSAINSRAVTKDLPYDFKVMKFRPRPDGVQHEVAFEVPVSGLRAEANSKTGKARVKASLVALIHDSGGQIVGKVSREVFREYPANESQPSKDRILYAEPLNLPGGHYIIDTAVTDEQSGKTAIKRLSVFVDSGKDFGLSSLELMRQKDAPAGRAVLDATPVDSAAMLPILSDSVPSGRPVNLYFVVYPKEHSAGDPKVVLQMLRDGREIARKAVTLPHPDADGAVPVMLRLSPQPGQCDILVTAQQGQLVAQSSLSVKVE